jgi:hypothetical protein
MVPITVEMSSYIVPETIKIRLSGRVDDTYNGHYTKEMLLYLYKWIVKKYPNSLLK